VAGSATSAKPRQRSEISLSLASGVGDEREDAPVRLQHARKGLGRVAADGLVRVLELVEGRLERQLLAADGKAQGGDRLVEEPVPGRASRHALLVEELLQPVVELKGLVLAPVLDPGAEAGERLGLHRPIHHGVVDPVELEGEEQEVARRRGEPLLRVAVELGPLRIGRVAGINEARKGHQPAEQVLDPLVAAHRLAERLRGVVRAGEAVELAPVGLGEGGALGLGLREVRREGGAVDAGVEVAEVPFRQGAEVAGARGGEGGRGLAVNGGRRGSGHVREEAVEGPR
jgi:hypothetical protein